MNINESISIKNVSFSKIISNKNRLYMYKGQSNNGGCEYQVVFVAADTEFIGQNQLGKYPLNLEPAHAIVQNDNLEIYQNFVEDDGKAWSSIIN